MTVLQIQIPDKKEKEIRLMLKEMGIAVKKVKAENSFTKKIKEAVREMNDVKAGKIQARNFDDLLNEL